MSMSELAIRVEGLGKQYRLGEHGRYRRRPPEETIWALKDVFFEVRQGEVVGVIGRNGAGKSTLLKILSRITRPTTGRAAIHGRVGSLLEVGTGFHPELTGRENIFLNGAILGMSRREIQKKFDEIVEFSEIERFLDTPVKRYSSGMYVRLAFAVAAHVTPAILLVDEVLAVGDASFQKKCLGKIGETARDGRTVLFVSHNMGAVRSLCNRAVLLGAGRLTVDGTPTSVVNAYLADMAKKEDRSYRRCWHYDEAPGSKQIRLLSVEITSSAGDGKSIFSPEEPILVRCEYQQTCTLEGMRLAMQVLTDDGQIAFSATDHGLRGLQAYEPGRYISMCHISGGLMNIGSYIIRIWVGLPGTGRLVEPIDVVTFTVLGVGNQDSFHGSERWPGVVCPKLQWDLEKMQDVRTEAMYQGSEQSGDRAKIEVSRKNIIKCDEYQKR